MQGIQNVNKSNAINPETKIQNEINNCFERNVVHLINQRINAYELLKDRSYSVIEHTLSSFTENFTEIKLEDTQAYFGENLDILNSETYPHDYFSTDETVSNSKRNGMEFFQLPSKNKKILRINNSNNNYHRRLFPFYIDLMDCSFICKGDDSSTNKLLLKVDHDLNVRDYDKKNNDIINFQPDFTETENTKNKNLLETEKWIRIEFEESNILLNSIQNVFKKDSKNKRIYDFEFYNQEIRRIKNLNKNIIINPNNSTNSKNDDEKLSVISKDDYKTKSVSLDNIVDKEIKKYYFFMKCDEKKIKIQPNIIFPKSNEKAIRFCFIIHSDKEEFNVCLAKNALILNAECDSFSQVLINTEENNFQKNFSKYFLETTINL